MAPRACPVCANPSSRGLPRYAGAHLTRCSACGLTFAGRMPTDEELEDHYRGYGTAWYDSPVTRRRYGELLDGFEPYRRTNRILDLGCGAGYFLAEAQQRGWEAYGIEFGELALEMNRTAGRTVIPGPISPDSFPPGHFDVVTAFEVVEHLADPRADARAVATVLRADGLFYCTTPNFDSATRRLVGPRWRVISYPEHLTYFTARTLRRWLAPFGFVSVQTETTGISPTELRRGLVGDRPAATHGPGDTTDEQLRVAVERSPALRTAKIVANRLLSTLRVGDTLKAHFELRS